MFVEHQEGGFVLVVLLIELRRDLGDAGDVLDHLLQLFGCLGELLLHHAETGEEGLGPVHQGIDALVEGRFVIRQQQLDPFLRHQALDDLLIEFGHHLAHRGRQAEAVVDQIVEMGQPALVVQCHATAHQAADHAMGLDSRRHQLVLLHQVGHGRVFQGVRFAHRGSAQSSGKYAEFMARILAFSPLQSQQGLESSASALYSPAQLSTWIKAEISPAVLRKA